MSTISLRKYFQGRTFSGIINRYLDIAESLPDYLAVYSTPEGRRGYDDTLQCLKLNFPQYVRELEGIAEGANVPFHKVNLLQYVLTFKKTNVFFQLFLLHMDDTILNSVQTKKPGEPTGCSTICINEKGQVSVYKSFKHIIRFESLIDRFAGISGTHRRRILVPTQ